MTAPDDELLRRLAAADPVDRRSLPTPFDDAPRQLLEDIMTNHASGNPSPHDEDRYAEAHGTAGPSSEEPVNMLELPEVPGLERRSRPDRSWALLAGAAAAVVLLVAGFLVFSPDNTTTALAAVQSAAQETARAESGRISATFTVDGSEGEQTATFNGGLDVAFSGTDLSFDLNVDTVGGEELIGPLGATAARLVDGVLYVNEGSEWYSLETGGLLGETLTGLIDPRSVLATVESLVETEEVATGVVVDGVETTQYRSSVDLGQDSLSSSGWLAIEGVEAADIHAEGDVTVDLFVDDDGLLRQLDLAGDLREPGDGPGRATFNASTVFFDLGADIVVEAPSGAVPVDPLQGFGSEGLGQGG